MNTSVREAAASARLLIRTAACPKSLIAAVTAAGFGPHDKWPHAVMAHAVDALALGAPAADAAGAAERPALAKWLLEVGDPAWSELAKFTSVSDVEAAVRTARADMANRIVANVAAAVDAAVERGRVFDEDAAIVDADAKKHAPEDAPDKPDLAERKRYRIAAMWQVSPGAVPAQSA